MFVLSSIYEGLPNVLLEAAVFKKLIISTNCPTGPKEILDKGKGGVLFKSGDYQDLSKKIVNFKDGKINKTKKIEHCFKRLDRFNYQYNLKKYQRILDKLIQAKDKSDLNSL